MKKRLFFMKGSRNRACEGGFVLPYVLFITTLVLIITTASIQTYESGMEITYQQIDQIKIETLFQMGLAKFKEEHLPYERGKLTVDYTFPAGKVTITADLIENLEYQLRFSVVTVNQSEYITHHTIKIPKEE